MHVVILCGGKGTRLAPLTDNLPKSLVDTRGRPFIHRQLSRWNQLGATRFSLLTGHLHEQIESSVGHTWEGVRVDYSHCEEEGTWPALANFLSEDSREFLLTYGDVMPSMRPPSFGPRDLVKIGVHKGVDIGAIWVRSDVCRIPCKVQGLGYLWEKLEVAGALAYYDSLPVHEIGSHSGLEKFNASL